MALLSVEKLRAGCSLYTARRPPLTAGTAEFVSGFTQAGFEAAVARIKDYILAGDCMQVVPSQRFTAKFDYEPFALYRSLRHLNPSPFLFFLDFGGFARARHHR